MHTSDANLIRIDMEGTRIISPDTMVVRLSLVVHHLPVHMRAGGGDATSRGRACSLWSNLTG
jgi:hypothetical protein